MMSARERILKGLPARMVVPVILVTAMVGAGLYFFVLRSVSEFTDRQIREALAKTSRDLYNVCDSRFSELMRSGRMGNAAAVRIQKARTLGAIEDFVRSNRVGCLVSEEQNGNALLNHAVPGGLEETGCGFRTTETFQRMSYNGTIYHLSHFEFRPWKWHVDLFKDTAEYAPLMHRVHLAYAVTGLLLLLSAFLLLWFFDRLLRIPIHRMISAIQSGKAPEYRGSRELEFLSDSISGMMRSLRERTAWLERFYSIALTARGEVFFTRVAEAVGDALGLCVIIVRWKREEEDPRVVGSARADALSGVMDDCLQGLPLDEIHTEKRPVVVSSHAWERLRSSTWLRAVSADSYSGVPFFDRGGGVLGTIHAFGEPRELDDWDTNLLKTAGQMVAAEFELMDREREKDAYRDQMFRAQKLESLGILAGGVAHDFNNLLMGIQGRASLMMLDADGSPRHVEHLRAIEEYVQSATDLTRQLLGFARGGKYEVRPADMNEVMDHSAALFGRTKKEIRLRRHFQPGLWSVDIDRRQIEQVLLNLYVNAWHAMPGGGDLVLKTENRELDEAGASPRGLRPGRYVKASVTDTGVGMDEATLGRIFDPFFTTKGMGRGTGLGLASAYGIIQNHGGCIRVRSEIGKGTVFSIFLPASDEAVALDEPEEEKPVRGTETILLVDDEPMILEVGGRMLESLGYRVVAAGSGPEALSMYRGHAGTVGMVILDMIMPGMGGGETFGRLKEMDPGVRVLLCSGYSVDGQARTILDQGCKGFIQKPFNLIELSKKVREALDGGLNVLSGATER